MAHSKLSNVCRSPAAVTSKLLSYSLPHTSQAAILDSFRGHEPVSGPGYPPSQARIGPHRVAVPAVEYAELGLGVVLDALTPARMKR